MDTSSHRSHTLPFLRPFLRFPLAGPILAVCVLLTAGPGHGQQSGEIAGRVLSAAGRPVADATVTLVDQHRSVSTRTDGSFELEAVPAGSHLLAVASPTQGSAVLQVSVTAGERTEVAVRLALARHQEEIVVTATPDPRSALELSQPVSVLSGDELAQRMAPTLGETLAETPGVSSTYFGPAASRPVIRGLGGDRVRMLQGGIGTGDVSSTSPDHAVSTEPLSAERIEVVRGPSTLLYGSSAIGGVVNVLDGRIPQHAPVASFGGYFDLRAGTVADELSGALALGGGRGRWAWHLEGIRRDTGEYEIPGFAETAQLRREHGGSDQEAEHGHLENSDLRNSQGSLGVSYFFGEAGFVGLSMGAFESNYGIPGAGHAHGENGEEEEEGLRIDMRQRRFDLQSHTHYSFGVFSGIKARLGVVDYRHDELEGDHGEIGTTFESDSWEARLELVQQQRGSLSGALGVQGRRRDLRAFGEEAFVPPNETTSWALFAFEEARLGAWRLQLGARFETQEIRVRSSDLPDRDYSGLSSSLGVVYLPTEGWSLGATVARSVKLPNAEELYSRGLHAATQTVELGDPGLGEETSLGLDLFLRRQAGRVTGELSLFANRFQDFIYPAFTGDEVEGFPVARYVQEDARFVGGELEARVDLLDTPRHHLDLELRADYVRAELRDSGEPLPRIPPMRLGVGVHYAGGPWQGAVEVRRIGEQDRVADQETPTPEATVLHASIGYRWLVADGIVDLLLRGRNLTDQEVRNHVSVLKDRVPLPGRDLSLALRYSF